ncbi:DUF2865 domain-containing protein [Alsobacter sp. KACC 23698]|uniref:DUF2865 domain-containing protein n=1 Tax=Alsobacter sp. KACC 23698 TaxID=3149229 RepID=A0AAU7JGX2_9HYPH
MTQSLTLIGAIRRTACAALLAVAAAGSPAQAAGLFDLLFGDRSPPRPPTYDRVAPPPPILFSPTPRGSRPLGGSGGLSRVDAPTRHGAARVVTIGTGGQAYCVRECDGYYFPLPAGGGRAAETELCSMACPGAQVEVFRSRGGGIDAAVSGSGQSYSETARAFAYRKASIPACGCRKPSSYAEWAARLLLDPTLRAGDLIVHETGASVVASTARPGTPLKTSQLRDIAAPGAVPRTTLAQADRMLGFTFHQELARAAGAIQVASRSGADVANANAIVVTPARSSVFAKSSAPAGAEAFRPRVVLGSPTRP